MKRMLLLFTITLYLLLLMGCSLSKQNPIVYKDTNTNLEESEESIKYKVEQVTLSKGYQNMEPNVEVLKKGLDSKLLASLGLVESSGVKVTEINKMDDVINIHVENQNKARKSQFVVPQILIDLNGINFKEKDNLKFNIVNENYEPIKVKIGANEAISKINADFQLSTNNLPIVNILNENDRFLWELNYNNIFDKHNVETPIINLSIIIDANNGDIVKSSKNFISSFIDEGYILNYIPNKYILYKKSEGSIEDGNLKDSLWKFNVEENRKQLLYSSNYKIQSAIPSTNANRIALIESTSGHSELYIIESRDDKAYKVLLKEDIDPNLIRWLDDDELYILDKSKKISNIYAYNVVENKTKLVTSINKDIVDLQIMEDCFLITEGNENRQELEVHLTKNWAQHTFNDYGFRPLALDKDKISYLKFHQEDNTNSLMIYDIKAKRNYDHIKLNIVQYFLLDNDNIGLVEKNETNNEFTLHNYNINEKEISTIANINSDHVFYNKEKELLYLNLSLPFESKISEIIYSLDLSKMTN